MMGDLRRALATVMFTVVVFHTTIARALDIEVAGASCATGFVVEKSCGIILTNRYVVKPGPVVVEAMFVNREEIPVYTVYKDHAALDLTEDERNQIQRNEDGGRFVYCPIVSCGARLNCLDDLEAHYHARHLSACAICLRVYPTSRLLSIHVSEAHDSFFAAKVAHGFPMYDCLVEGCGAKLKSYKSRKQHLIDKHKFPTSFEFKMAKPSKDQRQNSQHKQYGQMKELWQCRKAFTGQQKKNQSKKNPQNEPGAHCDRMEVENMDKLVSAVSKLSTSDSISLNISFGRQRTRAFTFLPRSLQQNVKHQSDA